MPLNVAKKPAASDLAAYVKTSEGKERADHAIRVALALGSERNHGKVNKLVYKDGGFVADMDGRNGKYQVSITFNEAPGTVNATLNDAKADAQFDGVGHADAPDLSAGIMQAIGSLFDNDSEYTA